MSKQGAMITLCMVNFIAMLIPFPMALIIFFGVDFDSENVSYSLMFLSAVMFIDMCAFYALGYSDEQT